MFVGVTVHVVAYDDEEIENVIPISDIHHIYERESSNYSTIKLNNGKWIDIADSLESIQKQFKSFVKVDVCDIYDEDEEVIPTLIPISNIRDIWRGETCNYSSIMLNDGTYFAIDDSLESIQEQF